MTWRSKFTIWPLCIGQRTTVESNHTAACHVASWSILTLLVSWIAFLHCAELSGWVVKVALRAASRKATTEGSESPPAIGMSPDVPWWFQFTTVLDVGGGPRWNLLCAFSNKTTEPLKLIGQSSEVYAWVSSGILADCFTSCQHCLASQ